MAEENRRKIPPSHLDGKKRDPEREAEESTGQVTPSQKKVGGGKNLASLTHLRIGLPGE